MNLYALQLNLTTKYDEILVPQGFAVIYDNMGNRQTSGGYWCRMLIDINITDRITSGTTPIYRTIGDVICQLNGPINIGDKDMSEKVDAIITAIRALTDSDIVFFSPYPTIIGQIDNQYRVDITSPFRMDHIET